MRNRVRTPQWPRVIAVLLGVSLATGAIAESPKAPASKTAKQAQPAQPATPKAANTVKTEAKEPVIAEAKERPLMALGAGDVVSLQVYGRPELATTTYIADDGSITVPLAGRVHVSGLSPTAAGARIATAYKQGQYLKNPQVTLLVTQPRSQQVSVLGEVRTPGRYVVEGKTTVLDLLALAGGTNERGGNTVFLIRANADGKLERTRIDLNGLNDGGALPSLALRGGDSIYVPQADQYYIYGQVQSPNMYRLEPAMTVLQAISRSGGLTEYGNERRIEIKRRDASGALKTVRASVQDPVMADDVIYVKEGLF